nr:protein FAR1-related sequence 5-like [Tanacetum cinerariifolium]
MVKETERSNGFQLDSSTCGCQLHNSCGLPCACRLALYMNSGEFIPLDSIDIFWRTLNLSPTTSLQIALGLGLSEDQWPQVRSDLVRELTAHREQYKYVFGSLGYDNIYKTVKTTGEWMLMPNTCLVIASAYNRVVICLADEGSVGASTICFPLWSSPPQSQPRENIVIAHVNVAVVSPKKVIVAAAAELQELAAAYTELLPPLAAASPKKVDAFAESLPPIIKGIIIKSYNIDACN